MNKQLVLTGKYKLKIPTFYVVENGTYILLAPAMIKYFSFQREEFFCITLEDKKYKLESDIENLSTLHVLKGFVRLESQFLINAFFIDIIIERKGCIIVSMKDGKLLQVAGQVDIMSNTGRTK